MKQKKIVLTIGAVALFVLVAIILPKNQLELSKTIVGDEAVPVRIHGPHLILTPDEYDFGKILQSGGVVSKKFTVFNNGSEDVTIDEILTSCSCTTATVNKTLLRPGESGMLSIAFDPNYHYEDEGRFFRTATIKSNIHGKALEAKIYVEVDYDLGKDALKFN